MSPIEQQRSVQALLRIIAVHSDCQSYEAE